MVGHEIVHASPSDADVLVALRDRIASWLWARGIRQWRPGEFDVDRMRAWISQGAVDVCRMDGRIVAAVAVLWEDPIWTDDDAGAGYVHLLMVDRDWAGHGLGDVMLTHAEQRLRQTGRVRSRLDAVSSNRELHEWYRRRGYVPGGTVHLDGGGLFDTMLFEKELSMLPAHQRGTQPAVADVESFLRHVVTWAGRQADVQAVGLAGSWARGAAGIGSDVDLVVVVDDVHERLADDRWLAGFGVVATRTREDWGMVQSWRVGYRSGLEVEYGLTTSDWLRTPLDAGTARVIADGFHVLYDPHGSLGDAIQRSRHAPFALGRLGTPG